MKALASAEMGFDRIAKQLNAEGLEERRGPKPVSIESNSYRQGPGIRNGEHGLQTEIKQVLVVQIPLRRGADSGSAKTTNKRIAEQIGSVRQTQFAKGEVGIKEHVKVPHYARVLQRL